MSVLFDEVRCAHLLRYVSVGMHCAFQHADEHVAKTTRETVLNINQL